MTAPSVKNLHMRDNLTDPGVDQDLLTPGYQTQVPVVTWNAVPGAASYDVEVTPYTGVTCDWTAIRPPLAREDGGQRVDAAGLGVEQPEAVPRRAQCRQ